MNVLFAFGDSIMTRRGVATARIFVRGTAMVVTLLSMFAAGCTLDPFYPETPAEISAEPNYVCNGDSVNIAWNLNLPLHKNFCEYPNGGYPDAQSCSTDSDCPSGGRCHDGMCCAAPIPFSECGPACPPDSTSTVTFEPRGPNQTVSQGSGRISFSPAQTTAVTLTGEWGPPTTAETPDSTRVVVVDEPPLENLVMGFPFSCMGSGYGWSSFDLSVAEVRPSAPVVIASVRNTSGYQIRLSDGVHSTITLDAGAPPTTDFNGPLAGTTWSASLTSLSTVGLPVPRCLPTGLDTTYPDLSIEVVLACESDSP